MQWLSPARNHSQKQWKRVAVQPVTAHTTGIGRSVTMVWLNASSPTANSPFDSISHRAVATTTLRYCNYTDNIAWLDNVLCVAGEKVRAVQRHWVQFFIGFVFLGWQHLFLADGDRDIAQSEHAGHWSVQRHKPSHTTGQKTQTGNKFRLYILHIYACLSGRWCHCHSRSWAEIAWAIE